jgi:hypothetical protein
MLFYPFFLSFAPNYALQEWTDEAHLLACILGFYSQQKDSVHMGLFTNFLIVQGSQEE